MNRAYSTFTIKAFNDEQHIIEGIASTPTPDRMGDVLEPTGAKFALPLPLLWQHDGHSPIGRVLSATVTSSGINIRAKIEHGILPEIDRAWALIKSGLVRGLSVGFRSIGEDGMEPLNPKQPWGAQRFKAWEWLELSAVTIPANQDASISVIKSLCAPAVTATKLGTWTITIPKEHSPALPSTGDWPGATYPPAAVGTSSRQGPRMSPISEQLTAVTADLKTKSARLEELVMLSGADGGLEEPQAGELTALTPTVEALTARVSQLSALEKAQTAMARPAYAPPPQIDTRNFTQPHYPQVTNPVPNTPPGIGLARAVICRMAALKSGGSAVDIAKAHYRDDPRIAMYLKEDVPAGSTADNVWAGPLVYNTNLVSEFIEFLRPQTIIGRINSFATVPFNISVGGQTSGATGYWVGEGRAKPLTWFNTNRTTLGHYKVANIIAITEELARFSNPSAETLVRNELAASCLERIDRDFVDPDKALSAGVSPASITNGIVNLNSGGTTLVFAQQDLYNMMNAFASNFVMPTHWIMSNQTALALSLMTTSLGVTFFNNITPNGGTLMGLPVITSQYCILGTPANNLMILIAAPEIFLADDGGFAIDVSREASLEMNDAPTMTAGALGSPTGATGSVVVSMFQTNSIAIRCERFINWARKRSSAVVWMDDLNYVPGT